MIQSTTFGRGTGALARAAVVVALALMTPACGGSTVQSGAALGKVGRGLSVHAHAVPQGAQACAMQEALTATGAATEKPLSDTCSKAVKSDLLWRKALVVLAAHSQKIESLATGTPPESAGQLEAALTGVRGGNWMEVEASDTAARDAVAKLVEQMGASAQTKSDLQTTIKEAGPHVKTICDGLVPYLENQAKAFGDIQKDIDKKRASRTDRRCGSLDNRPVCVSESVVDRLVYGTTFGQLAMMESNHLEAKDAVATFCAAHGKLDEAAANGNVSKDKTYTDMLDAVKASPRSNPSVGTGGGSAPASAGSGTVPPQVPPTKPDKK